MVNVFIIFPNQLFKKLPNKTFNRIVLVEDPRHFSDFKFHKKKLVFHRASMKYYQHLLEKKNRRVLYLNHTLAIQKNVIAKTIKEVGGTHASLIDPVDRQLKQRIVDQLTVAGLTYEIRQSPMFLCPEDYLKNYFKNKQHYAMSSFYSDQRKRLDILIDKGKPVGGKWSFDDQNRESLPRNINIPSVKHQRVNAFVTEAIRYVKRHFPENPGSTEDVLFPVTHRAAQNWLNDFIEHRLHTFGPYEDAIAANQRFLFHSLLSPLLNNGLLTPDQVLNKVIDYATTHDIPLNSLEGFVRQIIGWREFIRAVYILEGGQQAKSNFWGFKRKLPASFYTGNTGIEPVDVIIRAVLKNAYAHHIERLMVLGSFMLLCEVHPKEVFRWFSELFIDAYDWVMIPNVFGMSQYADGGRMSTKPYICGSNYIRKMSDFKTGPWCDIWDGLYWRFIAKYKSTFAENARMRIMAVQVDRMQKDKLDNYKTVAKRFLDTLS